MNKSSTVAIGGGIAAVVIAVAVTAFIFSGMTNEQQSMDSLVDDANENSVTLQETEKIIVKTSFFPYYEFARNVAGDSATVEQYLPSGIDVHDWGATISRDPIVKEDRRFCIQWIRYGTLS